MRDREKDIDLHKLLKHRAYDHALVTTFTFSARFFEEYMLERFKALQGNGNLTVFLDRGQYEEIIDAASSGEGWVPKLANRRYLLQPVEVPGVFHPKVFLFTTAKRGLLIVGSANFSQDGLGGNAELVSIFTFEAGKKEETLPLFQSAFHFFEQLSNRWPGREITSNINEVRHDSPWLTEPFEPPAAEGLPILLHNLDQPLWPQIVKGLGPVDELSLVSRFFDSSPVILDSVCKDLGTPEVSIHTQAKRGSLSPDWLTHPFAKDGRLTIHLCQYGDGEHTQPLHGKAYAIRTGTKITLAVGSANFSTSALLRPAASGNVEAMLLYPPEATGPLKPAELFDPLSSAKTATHPEQLAIPKDAELEPAHSAKPFSVLLGEASWDEGSLVLSSDANSHGLGCRLSQANVVPTVLRIDSFSQGVARLEPPLKWGRRMSESPTVAQLVRLSNETWEPVSNPVLVAALFDPGTGKTARQSRRLREAVESPQRFMGVLRELCEGDNEATLMHFLANCNIPFDVSLRSFRPPGRRSIPNQAPPLEFGHLGSRNLRHFEQLHDAAMSFTKRHRNRLSRHIENGAARSIPNFLHILETLILLLASQIERAKEGLTADPSVTLTANQWNEIRKNLSDYFQEIENLLELTVREYLPALHAQESRTVIQDHFGEAHEAMLATCTLALRARQTIAEAIVDRVFVETAFGTREKARFWNTLVSDEKWHRYRKTLKGLADEWRAAVAA